MIVGVRCALIVLCCMLFVVVDVLSFGVNCLLVSAYFVVCSLRCLVSVLFLDYCYVFGVVRVQLVVSSLCFDVGCVLRCVLLFAVFCLLFVVGCLV